MSRTSGQNFPPTDKKALDSVIVYEEKAGVKFTGWERDGGERESLFQLLPHEREHNSGRVCASLIPFDLAENCEQSCSAEIFTRA